MEHEKCAYCHKSVMVRDDAGFFFRCQDSESQRECDYDDNFNVTHCLYCSLWKSSDNKRQPAMCALFKCKTNADDCCDYGMEFNE